MRARYRVMRRGASNWAYLIFTACRSIICFPNNRPDQYAVLKPSHGRSCFVESDGGVRIKDPTARMRSGWTSISGQGMAAGNVAGRVRNTLHMVKLKRLIHHFPYRVFINLNYYNEINSSYYTSLQSLQSLQI